MSRRVTTWENVFDTCIFQRYIQEKTNFGLCQKKTLNFFINFFFELANFFFKVHKENVSRPRRSINITCNHKKNFKFTTLLKNFFSSKKNFFLKKKIRKKSENCSKTGWKNWKKKVFFLKLVLKNTVNENLKKTFF